MSELDLDAGRREELAGVLADSFDEWLHRMHGVVSSCRHETEAAAMADALAPLVTGWLAEAEAAAWDEGWCAGRGRGSGGAQKRNANPYRGGGGDA